MRLCAGVKFRPDFIAAGEKSQATLRGRQIKPAGVREEHNLEKRRLPARAHVHHGLDGFHEIRAKRWLAVAAERNVAEFEQFSWRVSVAGPFAQSARTYERECVGQFSRHHVHIQMVYRRWQAAIDLAVCAVEVAPFVRVHVYTYGKTAGARRDDHVNKLVVHKVARATEGSFRHAKLRGPRAPGFDNNFV